MESPLSALKKFLIGALLGIISFVPGVSGVVLAVTLGVYERIVEDIADIIHKVREDFNFLLLIGIGLVFGMVVVSFTLKNVIYTIPSMMLFLGMITGQLPHLWKYTMPEVKSSGTDIAMFVLGIVIMCFFLVFSLSSVTVGHDTSSVLLMLVIGVVYAIAHIAPGISGSTLLFAMGLLTLPLDIISSFDMVLLIPFALGTIGGLIGFAKIVHYAITKHRKPTYMMIFGLTIGSFLVVLKEIVTHYSGSVDILGILFRDSGLVTTLYSGTADILLGAVALFVGILISLWFSKIGKKTSEEFSIR